ncbi:MAG: hypothetical protein HY716_18850 [Planctomycetes bacterium]|nr:hypothetical protein [Planctomycetota bacterium]
MRWRGSKAESRKKSLARRTAAYNFMPGTGAMVRLAWLSILTGCAAASSRPSGPFDIPRESLGEDAVAVLDEPSAVVDLPLTRVESRPDIYEFLLEELPFTAGVLRELGRATYRIRREARPEGEPETIVFDDGEGIEVRAELVLRERTRWIYVTDGRYDLGLFSVWSRGVVIVVYEARDGALWTRARVYARLKGKVFELGALVLGLLESTIRSKALVFVDAAREVAELTAADPERLYRNVKGSREVDAGVLEEYRRRFLK